MKKIILLLMTIFILLTGCDYREINDMPMVTGMSIDKVEDAFLLTAQVIAPMATGGGASTKQIFINSAGKTIFDAVRDFVMKDGGEKIFWGHLGYIIISYDIAKENITEVLDYFIRDNEIRDDIYILIGDEGYKAEELFFNGFQEESLSFYVTDALKNVDSVSKFDPIVLEDLVKAINNKGSAIVIPILTNENVLNKERVIINDGVVLKNKKIVGEIYGEEIKIMRLLQNKEKGGIYVIDYKDQDSESKISFEIDKSKTNIEVEKTQKGYLVKIDSQISGFIGEIMNRKVTVLEYDKLGEFEKQAEEQIEDSIDYTIKRAQKDYGADIFGFNEKVKIKYPQDYKEIEDQWHSIFSFLEFEINVEVEVEGSALTGQTLVEGD